MINKLIQKISNWADKEFSSFALISLLVCYILFWIAIISDGNELPPYMWMHWMFLPLIGYTFRVMIDDAKKN